jgi:tRNA splicing ligase
MKFNATKLFNFNNMEAKYQEYAIRLSLIIGSYENAEKIVNLCKEKCYSFLISNNEAFDALFDVAYVYASSGKEFDEIMKKLEKL